MSDERRSEADRAFEQRARAWFDASVDGLDAGTRSRLNRSRQQALAAATDERRRGRGASWTGAVGVLAASVFVAVLLWRGVGEPGSPPLDARVAADEAPGQALEVLAANDDDLRLVAAEEDLEFYAWVEVAAATAGAGES
jgi:hypothetical protein